MGRYARPEEVGWQGWVEPADKAWVVFVRGDGAPVLYEERDAEGGVLGPACPA